MLRFIIGVVSGVIIGFMLGYLYMYSEADELMTEVMQENKAYKRVIFM